MSDRAQKWVLAGILVWLLCGAAPALMAYMAFRPRVDIGGIAVLASLLGVFAGVGTAAACLIHPRRCNRVMLAVALIWFVLWPVWLLCMARLFTTIGNRVSPPPPLSAGSVFDLGQGVTWGLLLVLPISSLFSAVVLGGVTRSWRVVAGALLATVMLGMVFVPYDSLRDSGLYFWHPIVVGALMLWAVPKRIHPFAAHACQSCGYDLRGLEAGSKCPECGAAR